MDKQTKLRLIRAIIGNKIYSSGIDDSKHFEKSIGDLIDGKHNNSVSNPKEYLGWLIDNTLPVVSLQCKYLKVVEHDRRISLTSDYYCKLNKDEYKPCLSKGCLNGLTSKQCSSLSDSRVLEEIERQIYVLKQGITSSEAQIEGLEEVLNRHKK